MTASSASDVANRVARLEVLQEVALQFAAERNLDRLLALILDRAVEVLDAERATLFLLEGSDPPALVSRLAQGVEEIRLPADANSIAGTAFVTGRALRIEDAYQDPRFNPAVDQDTGFRTRSILACPLRDPQGSSIGVFQVLNKRQGGVFTDDDEEMATALGSMAAIALENARWLERRRRNFQSLITGQAVAIDMRDHVTGGHTWRVAAFAVAIGQAMGLSQSDLELLRYAALLHDQGKLGIPDEILMKPGRLEDWEFELMRSHAEKTAQILEQVRHLFPPRLRPALDVAPAHHEKLDGSGYPKGVRGDEIPLGARILAVADILDALTADRPYRKPLPDEKVLAMLREDVRAGKLDARPVEALARCLPAIQRAREAVNRAIRDRRRRFRGSRTLQRVVFQDDSTD